MRANRNAGYLLFYWQRMYKVFSVRCAWRQTAVIISDTFKNLATHLIILVINVIDFVLNYVHELAFDRKIKSYLFARGLTVGTDR